MSEKPLQLRLETTDQHSGQFTLTFDSSQYPITLNLENFTISDWLRRLRPVLAGGNDPAGNVCPQDDLLRHVGMWLWRALLPESAPSEEREALAKALLAQLSVLHQPFPLAAIEDGKELRFMFPILLQRSPLEDTTFERPARVQMLGTDLQRHMHPVPKFLTPGCAASAKQI